MPPPTVKGDVPLAPLPSPPTSLTSIMTLPLLRSRTALQSPYRGYESPTSRMSPLPGGGHLQGPSFCSRLDRAQLGRILDQALLISASVDFARTSCDFQDDESGINDPSYDNE